MTDRHGGSRFLRVKPGGRGFVEPPVAATATYVSSACNNLHENAGLPGGTPYPYRRETANIVC